MSTLNITRDEAAARAAVLSVESYAVELDLALEGAHFGSRTTVTFTAAPEAEGRPTFIDFVSSQAPTVTLNGTALPADAFDGTRITLAPRAGRNTLVVDGLGDYMNTGEGLHRFVDPVDGETYLYTQFEVPDSRRMFAVFEQPDLKASFTFTVTAPEHWTVVSNSPTPEPVPATDGAGGAGGRSTWAFSPTPRISSYITALIAGPYRSTHAELTSADGRTIPLGAYCRASLFEYLDAENIFELTRRGFEFFEAQFGTPYPFEKYDQLFVPEFNAGAMENAGAVTFLENYVFRSTVPEAMVERRAITVLHELAHMWFGDLVTMRWWNDLWLNESFAEFMSTLAAAENTRYTGAWTTFSSMEKNWAYRQDQLSTTHPIKAEIRDLDDVLVNFDGITYAKGASVLRQLVAWVGQENFMAGVREYFGKHAWSNTELPDLMRELEASSGRDLSAWTHQWLETSGVNTLAVEVDAEESDDGAITSLRLHQSAPGDGTPGDPVLRPHRMAVGFYSEDGSGRLVRTDRFELDVHGAVTEVAEAAGRPRPDLILPNDDDLAYAKIRLDSGSWHTAATRLKDVAESLPRTLLWGAAWDTTRDADATAVWFTDLVLANIGHERDSSVVQTLLRQLATTLSQYAAPSHAPALRAAAADRLLELARQAEAGSDNQLQFVKAFALHARSGAQLDTLAALHAGAEELPGLDLNTDLRWEMLTGLVAGGRAGEPEIASAEAEDATATGALAAAQARAAVPAAEAKEAAWQQVVSGALSNMTQRNVLLGYNRVHEPELLAPFAERYFGTVEQLWASRSHEMAESAAVGLFPGAQVSQRSIDAANALVERTRSAQPALSRTVAEARDEMVRALAARHADAAARR
ncbi:aminopeptidase N [Citricoccus sp. SGAir0253]|uniref:aminopeptidase N n=1 Tax=Citricoccus sp. SGAir0253 TaxID=2567881 RepID=UPI0010CD5849|nr:aminopeptidase N [Citricoccus sp. SGAir0253]QCU78283.1 aminopeptidase N [Citricoccus sp. SGAir0253]